MATKTTETAHIRPKYGLSKYVLRY